MIKVYYDTDTYRIIAVLEKDVSPPEYTTYGFIYCTYAMLDEGYRVVMSEATDDMTEEVETEVKDGYVFPLSDVVKLKAIALYTIDVWRRKRQGAGWTSPEGVSYATTEEVRGLLIGKIQEMDVLGIVSGIFPDATGTPVQHTLAELRDVGVGIAQKMESDYLMAVQISASMTSPTVQTMSDIETILAPILGDL